MAFADREEIWYMETIGGHHWAAIRIPDDAYVIAPNRMNIATFDFDSQDTLFSDDLPDMIVSNHLNPDFEGINLRHIFGSATEKDTRYNNPRAWYIQNSSAKPRRIRLTKIYLSSVFRKENQRDGCKVGVEQSFSKYPL